MNKHEIINQLHRFTESEMQYSSPSSTPMMAFSYKEFDKYTDNKNRSVYYYTFEKHRSSLLEKFPQNNFFIESSQLLLVKHARFSYTPLHVHDFIEINYIYSGNVKILINDEIIHLNSGDFCLLDTGVVHQILETGTEDIILNFLISKEYFSTRMLSQLASNNIISKFAVDALSKTQKHNQYIIFSTEKDEFLIDAILATIGQFLQPSTYSHDVLNSYMIIIFSKLLNSFQKKITLDSNKNNQLFIGDILSYIEKNYATCSLSSVAKHFGYNPSYLSRSIRKQTEQPFITIIQEIKLKQATILLKNSDHSIEEIAHKVGYKNISFFYKKFNTQYGVSPKIFREMHLENS